MDTGKIDEPMPSMENRSPADSSILYGSASVTAPARRVSIRATCEAIGLPRSTYYYQPQRSTAAMQFEQAIVVRLHELRERFPDDGYRRLTLRLQDEGFHVNRKRIARLIQLHGLGTRRPRMDLGAKIPSELQATPAGPREPEKGSGVQQAWILDVSYIHIQSGLIYVAAIVDSVSRQVVGYALSQKISRHLASMALHAAIRVRRPSSGCAHHSTCGTQYVMRGYRELLRQLSFGTLSGSVPRTMRLASSATSTDSSNRIVENTSYETWEQISCSAPEFIRTVYSQERIDSLLDRLGPAKRAATAAAARPNPVGSVPLPRVLRRRAHVEVTAR